MLLTGGLTASLAPSDGDLDVIFGNTIQKNQIFLNLGALTFSELANSALAVGTAQITLAVSLADFDQDGVHSVSTTWVAFSLHPSPPLR